MPYGIAAAARLKARIAGCCYRVTDFVDPVSEIIDHGRRVIACDAAATAGNILAHEPPSLCVGAADQLTLASLSPWQSSSISAATGGPENGLRRGVLAARAREDHGRRHAERLRFPLHGGPHATPIKIDPAQEFAPVALRLYSVGDNQALAFLPEGASGRSDPLAGGEVGEQSAGTPRLEAVLFSSIA